MATTAGNAVSMFSPQPQYIKLTPPLKQLMRDDNQEQATQIRGDRQDLDGEIFIIESDTHPVDQARNKQQMAETGDSELEDWECWRRQFRTQVYAMRKRPCRVGEKRKAEEGGCVEGKARAG